MSIYHHHHVGIYIISYSTRDLVSVVSTCGVHMSYCHAGSNENNDVIIAASMVALVAIIVVLVAFICLAVCCGKRGRLILVRSKSKVKYT